MASAPLLCQVVDELGREPHFVQLMLSPLSRADTIALAQSLTGDGGQTDGIANLEEQIWRTSEGNPFMVVETIRALYEGTAPKNSTALPLPERVRRVVVDRLDHLSDRGRHLVSVAAVIGRQFDFGLLQRAAGLDEREAAESVEELVRRRVLHGVGERFDFSHERIREVAYAELIQPRRKILHVTVANALEHVYAGDLELHHATLAAHYRAGEVWDRALTHFREAGTRAVRLSAYHEASVCFEQALQALARLPETRENQEEGIDLRFALRNSLLPLGELDRIHSCLVEAEKLATALGDGRRLGWLSVYMSHHLRTAGDRRQARECANAAQGLGETLGDAALGVDADLSLGSACLSLGDYRRAAELFRRTVRSLDDAQGSPAAVNTALPAVVARAFLAQSLGELGDFEDGVASGAEAIRMAEALDDPLGLAYACMRLGRVYGYKGELQQATALLERSCGLSRDWQIIFTKPIAVSDLGLVYVFMGRLTEGLSLLHQAMDASEYKRGEGGKPRLLIRFAEACLLAGRVEEAHTHAVAAFARTSERGDRGYEARALRVLGAVAAHGDCLDVEASELRYRQAISLAAELGMRPLLARCHAGLGLLYRRHGTARRASQHLGRAANMFRELQMTYWLEQMDAGARSDDLTSSSA
jgi:tetratricopeptide (TPR) repeat protein